MDVTRLLNLRGWVFGVIACLLTLYVSGCRDSSVRQSRLDSKSAALETPASRTVWRELAVAIRSLDEDIASPSLDDPGMVVKLDVPDAGLDAIEVERADRLDRAREIAESRLERARTEMEKALASRLEARRREMQADMTRDLNEAKSRITAEYVNRVREIDTSLLSERVNLEMKVSALRSRRGLFGGKMDAEVSESLKRLQDQRDQLDKRRAESVESAGEQRDRTIAEVSEQLNAEMERDLAVFQSEVSDRVDERSRRLLDRLQAQMSGSSPARRPDEIVKVADMGVVPPASSDMKTLHGRAVGEVDRQFERDLALAVAAAQKRLEEARQRRSEDSALAQRTGSRAL